MARLSFTEGVRLDGRVSAMPRCRFCREELTVTVVDLGKSPLCNTVLSAGQLDEGESFYPLDVRACDRCWLVQLPALVRPTEIFEEYAYFSAYSDSWVRHARDYVDVITSRCALGPESLVVELGSNDGYLLQHFVARGVPVLGIDPARNVAEAAIRRDVPTLVEFFGKHVADRLVAQGKSANLIVGNNVLAQVPDINDFVAGVKALLAPRGTATFEFPHLARLLDDLEYDTIYHEHFSYFSLFTIREIFNAHGLAVHDVEELTSHGGSLRVFVGHADEAPEVSDSVPRLLQREEAGGLRSAARYAQFQAGVRESKRALLDLLIRAKWEGKQIVGYGAPGKGNTLLNYCGIRTDFLDYTVDRNPYKQGRFTPGTQIPIHPPERLEETRPDLILILPWNLAKEISAQLAHTASWGAQLVVPIPHATVFEPGSLPLRPSRLLAAS